VSTWGVFPRPKDISRSYGGGRTLRPGQALEPEGAAEERLAETRRRVEEYKKNAGLIVSAEQEREVRELTSEATQLQELGRLSQAAERFAAAAAVLPFRTDQTGEALLLQAVCLDSVGRVDEAKELYSRVATHPNAKIARKANQMLYGFTAAEDLKVDQVSFVVPPEAYEPFFQPLVGKWGVVGEPGASGADAPREEDAGEFVGLVAGSLALLSLPILLILAKAVLLHSS